MKREFFRRGKAARIEKDTSPPPARTPPPVYSGVSLVRLGSGQVRLMHPAEVARQRGRSKGGQTVQRTGSGHRWTSETGKAAITKHWKHVRRRKSDNRPLGLKSGRRKPLDYKALREQYSRTPRLGIAYSVSEKCWSISDNTGSRPLSETRALQILGHLPKGTRVPVEVLGYYNQGVKVGTSDAGNPQQEE